MAEGSPTSEHQLESLDSLELPSMTPQALIAHFGPGLILMMTGIGTSHLVTAPTAGGRFAYALLWFKIGLWDFRFGHVISFLIATVFLLLSAVWMYPSAVEGRGVMGEIATIFTESVGPWMMIVFNYFDGWP